MKKAKQRSISGINNAPLTAMEQAAIDKELLKPKNIKPDKLSNGKSGLTMAGLKSCSFGEHNPNFGNKPLNMY